MIGILLLLGACIVLLVVAQAISAIGNAVEEGATALETLTQDNQREQWSNGHS